MSVVEEALLPFYRLAADDAALRAAVALDEPARGPAFSSYRQHYPLRRELRGVTVVLSAPRPLARALLSSLGATVELAA